MTTDAATPAADPAPQWPVLGPPDRLASLGRDGEALAELLRAERGEPQTWAPLTRRRSLAAAVIHAVMSPRITRATVDGVVNRYEQHVGTDDGASRLAASFAERGAEGWQEQIGTRHRTASFLTAPHKSVVIEQAAHLLVSHGVETREHLLDHALDDDLRAAWCALPGQGRGYSWRHLLAAGGRQEPLVCPLTRHFVKRSVTPHRPDRPAADVVAMMMSAAASLRMPVGAVDTEMWRAAYPRRSRTEATPRQPAPTACADA